MGVQKIKNPFLRRSLRYIPDLEDEDKKKTKPEYRLKKDGDFCEKEVKDKWKN